MVVKDIYKMIIPHSKPYLSQKDFLAVQKLITSGMIAEGTSTCKFESRIASYLKIKYVKACSNGTSALILILKSLNIGKNDEVILPTYVCKNVLQAVILVGATPVLCDVSEEWVMTVQNVTPLITTKTKAIIVVHIFGIVADLESFLKLGINIIEDACQSFGSKHQNKYTGTVGIAGFFSFHATKCLTTGEGGAVVTSDFNLYKKINSLVTNNISPYRISDLQSTLGISQLSQYNNFLFRRRKLAENYFNELTACNIKLPEIIKNKSIFFRFPILLVNQSFQKIQQEFFKKGIAVRKGVDRLLHREMKLNNKNYPVAEMLFKQTVSIPIYPSLTNDQQEKIITACKRVFK